MSDETPARAQLARQVKADAALSDFVKPLPKVLGTGRHAIATSFNNIAKRVGKMRRTSGIQFAIRDGRKVDHWCLLLHPEGCTVLTSAADNPDLEILTDSATWKSIAAGKLAFLEAYLEGNLRVRGDLELARLFARRLGR